MAASKKNDSITKKIIKILKNYGLNINSMSDDELQRMKKLYKGKSPEELNRDLEASEKFIDEFSEKII